MKNLSVLLLVFLVSSFHYCLFSQDTVRVMRPNNPPEFMRPSVRIDSTYPPITCSSFEDGKKAALRDISKNRVRIQMKDKRWCTWHDHFTDSLQEKYKIQVRWEYEQKPSDYFDEGYCGNSGYTEGYYSTMDSVLTQIMPDSKLKEFINLFKQNYGTSEKSCPDIYYDLMQVSEIAKPKFDDNLLNGELSKKAAQIDTTIAGRIAIQLTIFSDGSVLKADILRGIHNEIDKMVSNTFLDLEFIPCTKDDEPISCSRTYVVKIN